MHRPNEGFWKNQWFRLTTAAVILVLSGLCGVAFGPILLSQTGISQLDSTIQTMSPNSYKHINLVQHAASLSTNTTLPQLCSSAVCEQVKTMWIQQLDTNHGACDNFYSFVCGKSDEIAAGKSPNIHSAPFITQATLNILNDLDVMFDAYFKQKQSSYYEVPGAFLNQAIFFLPNCTSVYSRNGLGWDPWPGLLRMYQLKGWPFQINSIANEGKIRFSSIVGFLDAELGVSPFFDLSLRKEPEQKFSVHISPATTIYQRYKTLNPDKTYKDYLKIVENALNIIGVNPEVHKLAENVVILEMRLEDALVNSETDDFPSLRQLKLLKSLPMSDYWDWTMYIKAFELSNVENVMIERPFSYVEDVIEIMKNTSMTTLLNYVGFRLLVHVSALLPDEADFLVGLSYPNPVGGIPTRLAACFHLMEGLWPQGTRTFQRMILGQSNPLRYNTQFDLQLETIFNATRFALIKQLLSAKWFSAPEKIVAREKLLATNFTFLGSQRDLAMLAGYYDALGSKPFEGDRLLQSYRNMKRKTRRVYFTPENSQECFDNNFHTSSLTPDVVYDEANNQIVAKMGLIANFHKISTVIEPVYLAPIIMQFLGAMYQAVSPMGSSVDHKNRFRTWWSPASVRIHDKTVRCFTDSLREQVYRLSIQHQVENIRNLHESLSDSLLIGLAYENFWSYLKTSATIARKQRFYKDITFEQMFFISLVGARCGIERNATLIAQRGLVPLKVRTNVALRNFPPFSAAFGCNTAPLNDMVAIDGACNVW